jgi:hypothetical protein
LVDLKAASSDAREIKALETEAQSGVVKARHVFRHHAQPQLSLAEIRNHCLLSRLDNMGTWDWQTGEFHAARNMRQLAIQVAKENALLPREEQRGAGGIEADTLARHIKTLVDNRDRELEAGTWFGPINHEQAIRYFHAQNIATFSNKK